MVDLTVDSEYIFVGETDMDTERWSNDTSTIKRKEVKCGSNDGREEDRTTVFARQLEEIESSLTEELFRLQQDLDLQIDENSLQEGSHNVHLEHKEQREIPAEEHPLENENTTSSLKSDMPHFDGVLYEQRVKYDAIIGMNTQMRNSGQVKEHLPSHNSADSGACILGISADCDNEQLLLLPCLHAVCKPCVDQHEQTLVCKCGREIKLEIEDLPFDFVNRNESLLAKDKFQCGYLTYPCSNKVISYCTKCKVSMCSDCQDVHGRIKLMSSHEIIPIDDVEKCPPNKRLKASTCIQHPGQRLLYLDKQCHQSLCHLCLTGTHAGHEVTDLEEEYTERKRELSRSLETYGERLKTIQSTLNDRCNRLSELQQQHDQLVKQIVEVNENVAMKYIQRLKELLQEVNEKTGQLQDKVKKDIQSITEKEASFQTTITYAKRCCESTTQAEFLALSEVISNKISDDLNYPLSKDRTRGKYIVFFSRGEKALDDLLKMFGDVRCSHNPEARKDDIPILSELQEECKSLLSKKTELSEQLTLKEQEIETEKQVETVAKDRLHVAERKISHLQDSLHNLGVDAEVTPYPLMTTAVKMSLILHCVHLKFDQKKVNLKKTHINKDDHLVNAPESRPHMYSDRGFQKYCGTTSIIPIRKAGGPQYMEILVGIGIDKLLLENVLLLNIGFCREKDRDIAHYIPPRQHCYSLEVGMCNKHDGVCTRIWKDGKTFSHQSDTVRNIESTDTSLHYGIVCDSTRGKIAFLDLTSGLVISVLEDVNFNQPLWPMFGLYKLDGLHVEMSLVSGKTFEITAEKKLMILRSLT